MAFDAIVIGSGFGGAITARRLAERGMRVLVLERGRRWEPRDYPRTLADPWIFSPRHPARRHGWFDVRFFRHVTVVQAAALGGGSLTYSGVALEVHPDALREGWPPEITWDELKPYYDLVAREMSLGVIPDPQVTPRFQLAREAAHNLGYDARFSKAGLAISFSPEWRPDLPEAYDVKHSTPFVNAHGQRQGTCVHLGNCDIGCDVRAKNTLDVNYLPRAEQHGADVRPLHLVRRIEPAGDGYRVVFDRITGGTLVRGDETARLVVVAAGSLGTTELLLRCRDEFRTLPHLSAALGTRWSANANFIATASYRQDPGRVRQSLGPPITGLIDFTDGSIRDERFVIEDDGFPNVLLNMLGAAIAGPRLAPFRRRLRTRHPLSDLMVWLGAGHDAANGVLRLKARGLLSTRFALDLAWDRDRSRGVFDAMAEVQRELTRATGGRWIAPPGWRRLRNVVTLHPLGGCPMGTSAETGVVDHLGRVFGYPNLIVADGAIVPTSTGRNPSHTIAALAERIAAHVV